MALDENEKRNRNTRSSPLLLACRLLASLAISSRSLARPPSKLAVAFELLPPPLLLLRAPQLLQQNPSVSLFVYLVVVAVSLVASWKTTTERPLGSALLCCASFLLLLLLLLSVVRAFCVQVGDDELVEVEAKASARARNNNGRPVQLPRGAQAHWPHSGKLALCRSRRSCASPRPVAALGIVRCRPF